MITVEIKESKVVGTEFPKLMKGIITGMVVLFTAPEVGTIVVEGGSYKVGEHEDAFFMSKFEDFTGELILKND
jgi:hypothetical protein